jgi:hypothetical protein
MPHFSVCLRGALCPNLSGDTAFAEVCSSCARGCPNRNPVIRIADAKEDPDAAQDYDFLYKAGIAAVFGSGTPVAYSAKVVRDDVEQEIGAGTEVCCSMYRSG